MDIRDPKIIVALAGAGVAVISLALVWATYIMIFPACVGMIVSGVIATILGYRRYRDYSDRMKEIWYQDAFNYADEIGDPQAVYAFKYPKDVARKLRARKFNLWIKVVAPLTVVVLAVILLITGFGVVVK